MENLNYQGPWKPPGGTDLNGNVRGMTLNVAPPAGPFLQPPEDAPIDLSFRKEPVENEVSKLREIGTIIVDNRDVVIKIEKDDENSLSNSGSGNETSKLPGKSSSIVPVGLFGHVTQTSEKKTSRPQSKGRKTVEPIIEFLKERSNKTQVVAVTSMNHTPAQVAQSVPEPNPVPIVVVADQNGVRVVDPDAEVKIEPVEDSQSIQSSALVVPRPDDVQRLALNKGPSLQTTKPGKKTPGLVDAAEAARVTREDSPEDYTNVINITPQENLANLGDVETQNGSAVTKHDETTVANRNTEKRNVHVISYQEALDMVDKVRAKHAKTKRRVPPEYRKRKSYGKKKKNVKVKGVGPEQDTGVVMPEESSENVGDLGIDAVAMETDADLGDVIPIPQTGSSRNTQSTAQGDQLGESSGLLKQKSRKKKTSAKSVKSKDKGPDGVQVKEASVSKAKKKRKPKAKKCRGTQKKNADKLSEQLTKSGDDKESQSVSVGEELSPLAPKSPVKSNKTARKSTSRKKQSTTTPPVSNIEPRKKANVSSVVCDEELEFQARSLISNSMKKMLSSAKKAAKSRNKAAKASTKVSDVKKKLLQDDHEKIADSVSGSSESTRSGRRVRKKVLNFEEDQSEILEEEMQVELNGEESEEEWLPEDEFAEEKEESLESKRCNNCNKDLETLDEVQNHTCLGPAEQTKLSCVICNKSFVSKDVLINHLEGHFVPKEKFTCKFCGRQFKTAYSCRRHESYHDDGRGIICDICSMSFPTEEALTVHKRIHILKHMTFPHTCVVCSKVLPNSASYSRHEKIHWDHKPHKCQFCGRGFTEKQNCKTHERRHLNERPFKCEHCPAKFYSQGEKIVHQKIHSGERNYQCMTCKKRFRTDSILRSHLLVHLNLRPFKCEYCAKGFKRKRDCEIHVRSHFGIKPFTCEICEKGFTSRGNLNQHHRLHESLENSSLKCKFCERHFRWHHSLSIHEEWHKKLQCRICSVQCNNKSSLRQHEQEHLREVFSGEIPNDLAAETLPRYPKSMKTGKRKVKKTANEKKLRHKKRKKMENEDDMITEEAKKSQLNELDVTCDKTEVECNQSDEMPCEESFLPVVEKTVSFTNL